jgi:hypothetical protein
MPYATTLRDGTTLSAVPAMIVAERNFIVANYAADGGCLDNGALGGLEGGGGFPLHTLISPVFTTPPPPPPYKR